MHKEPCTKTFFLVPCPTFSIVTMCQKSVMLHVSDVCWKSDGQAIMMSQSALLLNILDGAISEMDNSFSKRNVDSSLMPKCSVCLDFTSSAYVLAGAVADDASLN